MNTEETFKEKRHHRFWLGAVMCRLFHPIETLENCSFIDKVTGKSVGKFRCKKCGVKYLANSKRDMFRCYEKKRDAKIKADSKTRVSSSLSPFK